MAWYTFWKKPKRIDLSTEVVKSQWRNNMWVMSPQGIGILFKLDHISEVHLVDNVTGETVSKAHFPLNALRQAKLNEIPKIRKMGLTKEKAAYLGYF